MYWPVTETERAEFVARFWSYVDIGPPDRCWLYMRYRDPQGYGIFTWRGRDAEGRPRRIKYRAPRVAWYATHGTPPPDNQLALHRCDNAGCCNPHPPNHIYLGSSQDNVADRERPLRRVQLRERRRSQGGQDPLFPAGTGISPRWGSAVLLEQLVDPL